MKKSLILVILVVATGISAQEIKPGVADLSWMAGCWEQKGKNEGDFLSERWTKPMGMMIGTNRLVRNNKVKFFEYLRIEERGDGIYYVAKPSSAAKETAFKMISHKDGVVVFENKLHDFPKQIIYRRTGEVGLEAEIKGDSGGTVFKFERISCD